MKTSVAGRLSLGFGAMFLFLILSVAAAFHGAATLNDHVERMVAKDWTKVALAKDISYAVNDVARLVFSMFIETDGLAEKKQRIQAQRQKVIERIEALDKVIYAPRGRELFERFKKARTAFAETYPKVVELLEQGKREEASQLFTKTGMPQLQAYVDTIDDFVKLQGELFEEGGRQAEAAYAQVRLLLLVVLFVALVSSAAIAVWIIRSVTRPLGGEPEHATAALTTIAGGNLAVAVATKPGDTGSLLHTLENMRQQMGSMIREVQGSASQLGQSAEALAANSEQVARASASQSEASATMAAAVEQLTTSIAHVSASAGDARRMSADSGQRARSGKETMQETAASMAQIADEVGGAAHSIQTMGESSQRISSVVQVIREVAEQTNLLALNAAIEAARAGEQGRGFAVVADEVRKLAERTSSATTEIASMIDNVQAGSRGASESMERIVEKVNAGVAMAQQASGVMAEIADGAETVVHAVNDISSALEEQAAASQQLAQNVEHVAQMSEENNQATRKAADTAIQLGRVAGGLQQSIARFQTA